MKKLKHSGILSSVVIIFCGCLWSEDEFHHSAIDTATEIVYALSENNTSKAYERFGAVLTDEYSLSDLTTDWENLIAEIGKFKNITRISSHKTELGEKGAVAVYLKCEHDSGQSYIVIEVSTDEKALLFSAANADEI